MSKLVELRRVYHRHLCDKVFTFQTNSVDGGNYPNFADAAKKASVSISLAIIKYLDYPFSNKILEEQGLGKVFTEITRDYLQNSFDLLQHLRPGEWRYETRLAISQFDQYKHLAEIERLVDGSSELASALGKEYIITPDIIVSRAPVTDIQVNQPGELISPTDPIATFTPLREANTSPSQYLLHASISCKWTIRSDRSQNARTEALNLIRHRKGHLPHIVAVIAEPLPTRIASLALGTGDLDCAYHFALHEMKAAILEVGNDDQMDMLDTLIAGRRLRDISDLPFDLAI